MSQAIHIGDRKVGPGQPVYVVAELSANHQQKFEQATALVRAAKEAGADAVKLQTYTADTLTIRCASEHFKIRGGTLWDGRTLHDLYQEAYTPWEWQPKLKDLARELGMDLFSSPFDATAVDFLERMGVPAYKVASFELVDLPLIRAMARTGKPLILSTGMATEDEIAEAMQAARNAGTEQLALLKCTSEYPARPEDMNLRAIPFLRERFEVPVGLSDHSPGDAAAVAAVALGACIVEKHLTLSRAVPGPDSKFSMEAGEFSDMVRAVRTVEKALGTGTLAVSRQEAASKAFRRSLFVVSDVKKGQEFTRENVRSIRPGNGLHTRHLEEILGKRAASDIERGTPLSWELITRP